MRKFPMIFLLITIFLSVVSSSCQHSVTTAPLVIQVASEKEISESLLQRDEKFKGALSLDAKLMSLQISETPSDLTKPHIVSLTITIINLSSGPMVVKKPITIGAGDVKGYQNDLRIMIGRKDGNELRMSSTSNYPEKFLVRDIPPLTEKDFMLLEKSGELSFPVVMELPIAYIESKKMGGNLPKGEYVLTVGYANKDVGYVLPLSVTPPASFANLQEDFEWHFANTMIADLNAWVGYVQSNKVEFSIP